MLYLLLLLFAVPAAHAAKCRGLNTISGYDDICDSEESPFSADNINKTSCSISGCGDEDGYKGSQRNCARCNIILTDYRYTLEFTRGFGRRKKTKATNTEYYFYYDSWELKICNNNTGEVPMKNSNNFVCQNEEDARFLCIPDPDSNTTITPKICRENSCIEDIQTKADQSFFKCKCNDPEGGEFDGNCNFISNEDLLVTALYIITAVAIFIKYVAECCQKEKTNQRCSQFSTFMLIVLLLVSLGFWIFAEYSATFPFAFFLSLIVLALKVGRVWYVNKQEGGNITVEKIVKAYRDDRFNVI